MAAIIMLCYARSGGTVLNQCLGSLPNVIILSEVNPQGSGSGRGKISYKTVREQAKNWYQIDLKSDEFAEGILELESICAERGKHLIVRDWTYVNFIPDSNAPNRLLTLEALAGKCELTPFAFVRNAIDVWISLRCPEPQVFFPAYLRYVKAITERELPIFKYEDFCQNPEKVLRGICEVTGLEYTEAYKNYSQFDKVHGDIQILSRGRQQGSIKPLRRKLIAREKIAAVEQCPEMVEANRLLGYPTAYADVLRERIWTKWVRGVAKITSKL
jgi:hypothetical protein